MAIRTNTGRVNLVLVSERDAQSDAFDAMKRMFAIQNADDPHIAECHKGDAKFWAMVEQYRQRAREKAEAAKEEETPS
jgi:hypothetical protein